MSEPPTYHNALPLGSLLAEYKLEAVLGAGGFGMTYLGWDSNLEKHVAIKEYLPTDLAVRALDGSVVPITTELLHDYKWGLDRFILEARTLAKFSHPHIVRVMRFFEAHGTGYMVMEYEQGESLNQLLKRAPQPDEAKLKALVMPLLDGLEAVHAAGFLHRDIKPGNIFLRASGSPVLIDFGAARQAIGGATKSLTSVLTPGYAPLEQYASDGNQGPWSDIYAMSGVLYRALANDNPPDAVSRLKGDPVSANLAALRGRVSQPFLRAVEWALALDEKQRPQSVAEWRRALAGAAAAPLAARPAPAVAPTVRLDTAAVPPAGPSSPDSEPRRTPTRPRERPRSSGWRWIGIGALLFAAAVVGSTWNKQRQAKLAAEEQRTAQQLGAKREAELRRAQEEQSRRIAAGAGTGEDVRRTAPQEPWRARPDRDRGERPATDRGPDPELLRRRTEQEFRAADRNGDGYLGRDEVEGRMPLVAKEFQRIDADGDGRLSPQELMQFRRQMAQRLKKQ